VAAGLVVGGSTGAPTERPAPHPPAVQAPVGSVAAPAARPPAATSAGGLRPSTVALPALGVRAEVDPIDVAGGTLTPPADPRRVGWWAGGARPGTARGTAVVTGHTVHDGGGAFDRLDELAPGDRVVVASAAQQVRYEVASVRVLSRAELARRHRSVFRQDGPGRLVLVTCEDWDGTAYRSNVVVVARQR
jgi:LPXTG-site transpeptidase (sortase) family protein